MKFCLGFIPSVSIYKREKSPKSDRRKAEKSVFQKAFVGKEMKDLCTSFHSAGLCSASCLTRLFTCHHKSRWQATKGHIHCKEL
jgi:hypothetical protein